MPDRAAGVPARLASWEGGWPPRSASDAVVKRSTLLLAAAMLSLCWVGDASAQHIPDIVVAMALSPIVLLVLSIVLGLVAKNWKLGVGSVALGAVWVAWFILASMYITTDVVIWIPLFGLAIQLLALVVLIIQRLASRAKASGGDA